MLRNKLHQIHQLVTRWLSTRPGLAEAAPAAPPDADLFVSRTLVAAQAAALGVFGVAFAFLIQVYDPSDRAAICDASVEGSCGPGRECRAGVCVAQSEVDKPFCAIGGACDEQCECTGACEQGVCVEAPVRSAACDDPDTRLLIAELVKKHEQCTQKVGSFVGCSAPDIREFLLDNPRFKKIEQTFPDVTLLTFPPGKPAPRLPYSETRGQRGGWPDKKTREFYASRLRAAVPAFQQAQHILIFGRASATDNEVEDFTFAQSRVSLAHQLIVEESGKDTASRTRIGAKILEFSLGGRSELKFAEVAAKQDLRIVPYRSQELRDLLRAVDRQRSGKLVESERAALEERINRSVTIVAITCQGAAPASHGAP